MKTRSIPHHSRGVAEFLAHHADDVTGVVHGFDRLRFQGTLRPLYHPEIMAGFLQRAGVLWKDFKGYVCGVTSRIRTAADTLSQAAGRGPVRYLRRPSASMPPMSCSAIAPRCSGSTRRWCTTAS